MTLTDYNTAETIRTATIEEWAHCVLAGERNGGAGAFKVDGRTVYVEGDPSDLDQRITRLAEEAAEAGDLEGHALYTSPDGARPAVLVIAEAIVRAES